MRYLLLVVLCLFATPSRADTVTGGGTSQHYLVHSDTLSDVLLTGYFSYSFQADLIPGDYDPINGPYYWYNILAYANGSMNQAIACSQFEAHCGREIRFRDTTFSVRLDDEGYGNVFANVGGEALNMILHDFSIDIFIPGQQILGGDITVTAVPEPSTWLMMMLGFLLLGVKGFYRIPLRRIRRLVNIFQHRPNAFTDVVS